VTGETEESTVMPHSLFGLGGQIAGAGRRPTHRLASNSTTCWQHNIRREPVTRSPPPVLAPLLALHTSQAVPPRDHHLRL